MTTQQQAATNFAPEEALFGVVSDPMAGSQWHLQNTGQNGGVAGVDLNLGGVWSEFTGRGVRVGIIDDGFNYAHGELARNYNTAADWDARGRDADAVAETGDNHGTAVAGVIAAAANGAGTVGVAFDATLVGLRMGYGVAGGAQQIVDNLVLARNVDVVNNSWGFGGIFSDDFKAAPFVPMAAAVQDAAEHGRDGLGTVFVFAAGNGRTMGDNVNHHNFQNSIYTMAVAAIDNTGKAAYFSTPGAAVHVAAPGVNILTTDKAGSDGYAAGDYATVSGTSFSAPTVTGIVALMLQANPELGYRDVQEILAYTARKIDAANPSWVTNVGHEANGGGLHHSNDYGFGLVDAHAAVRLAETWTPRQTAANLATASATKAVAEAIPDNAPGGIAQSVTLGAHLEVERIEVDLNITHSWIGDLRVILVSPGGTESVLLDRPGREPGSTGFGAAQDNVKFTVTSSTFWGEDSAGSWTLKVSDNWGADVGTLKSWSLHVHGDAPTADDLYVYTNEYASAVAASPERGVIRDASGSDTLNGSALTGVAIIDLTPGGGGVIAGKAFSIAAGAVIENAYGGDGDDRIAGNAAGNDLHGGRGADMLFGADGDDELWGDAGDDVLDGGAGIDIADFSQAASRYEILHNADGSVTVRDLGGAETDMLRAIEFARFADQTVDLAAVAPPLTPADEPGMIAFSNAMLNAASRAAGYTMTAPEEGDSTTLTGGELGLGAGAAGARITVATSDQGAVSVALTTAWNSVKNASIADADGGAYEVRNFVQANASLGDGGSMLSVILAKRGVLITGAGDDSIDVVAFSNGGIAADNLFTISSGDGDDAVSLRSNLAITAGRIDAGAGDDHVVAGAGKDIIRGGTGNDDLTGGAGKDVFLSRAGDGHDIIRDFNPAATDRLQFEGIAPAGISLEARGADTIVHFGLGDDVTLIGLRPSQLDAADFIFS